MTELRQQAFQQLRPVCVELSSVALKFKANQVSAKAVLLALQRVHDTLQSLSNENRLDEKLAEYAFFPLTHIFNQSQRLSSCSLELAVGCVQVLVSRGWRNKMKSDMAKQLLILMGLLVSRKPTQQSEPATDELKAAAYECMSVLIYQVASSSSNFLGEKTSQSIVDQLVYQLLEALIDTASEHVQVSAAHALLELQRAVDQPPLLASLLPRSISTLVKVLRPSTQAKRTSKVLVAYLQLLTELLRNVLSDEVISHELANPDLTKSTKHDKKQDELVLDKSWLDATTPQIDMALVQVLKLRSHQSSDVINAILDLCLTVVNDCSDTLARSIPTVVDTLAGLCVSSAQSRAKATLKHLILSKPEIGEVLSAKFYGWTQALPRVMQGNDDRPKRLLLSQVSTSFSVLAETSHVSREASTKVASVLVDTVAAAVGSSTKTSKLVSEAADIPTTELIAQGISARREFMPVILAHQSQSLSTSELKTLIETLKGQSYSGEIVRCLVDRVHEQELDKRLSATWLALQFLRSDERPIFDVMDYIEDDASTSDLSTSRPFLVSDLYSTTLSYLPEYINMYDGETDSRLVALSLESLVLQASQLGQSYRPDLVDTLFPLLTLLGSSDALLQQHAMTALNLLAIACQYDTTAELVMENVDYLINAVALRLNAFDVSKNSLQVITMMVRLCGGKLLPHLDDLIGSIFGALDSFHGYPGLVEQLFEVLRMIVTESSKAPAVLAIESGTPYTTSSKPMNQASQLGDLLGDISNRRQRKGKSDEEHEAITAAPHRPWRSENISADTQQDDLAEEDVDDGDIQAVQPPPERNEVKPSRSHQLILNIAESAVPHVSSPSAKVRLTLLELLQDICPMLSQHENSFLPLVNSIWPAVTTRLFDNNDTAYNIRAAVVTMDAICRAAGDFMASRIEDVFPQLENLFVKRLKSSGKQTKDHKSAALLQISDVAMDTRRAIATSHEDYGSLRKAVPSDPNNVRTSDGQVLDALVNLLVTILGYVRVSEDNADKIFDLLGPWRDRPLVRRALEKYDEDAVWLENHRS